MGARSISAKSALERAIAIQGESAMKKLIIFLILISLFMASCGAPASAPDTTPPDTTPPNATPRSDCEGARFVTPLEDAVVPAGEVEVAWTPPECLLVVQYYQREKLVEEHFEVPSPTTFNITTPGDTELKIWVHTFTSPEQNIWITVK